MYENKFYSIEPWIKSSQNIYMYYWIWTFLNNKV